MEAFHRSPAPRRRALIVSFSFQHFPNEQDGILINFEIKWPEWWTFLRIPVSIELLYSIHVVWKIIVYPKVDFLLWKAVSEDISTVFIRRCHIIAIFTFFEVLSPIIILKCFIHYFISTEILFITCILNGTSALTPRYILERPPFLQHNQHFSQDFLRLHTLQDIQKGKIAKSSWSICSYKATSSTYMAELIKGPSCCCQVKSSFWLIDPFSQVVCSCKF